jgi:hypothetical protein
MENPKLGHGSRGDMKPGMIVLARVISNLIDRPIYYLSTSFSKHQSILHRTGEEAGRNLWKLKI